MNISLLTLTTHFSPEHLTDNSGLLAGAIVNVGSCCCMVCLSVEKVMEGFRAVNTLETLAKPKNQSSLHILLGKGVGIKAVLSTTRSLSCYCYTSN